MKKQWNSAPLPCNEIAGEEWRAVVGYPGYGVSNLGRVRSWLKKFTGTQAFEPHLLRCKVDYDGYRCVVLMADSKRKNMKVCWLVAAAFIGPRPDGLVVSHDNGLSHDDRADNLLYKTQLDNIKDQDRHGTKPFGTRHHNAKLTEERVSIIRLSNEPGSVLARQFGVSPKTLNYARRGVTWTHVSPAASAIAPSKGRPPMTPASKIGRGLDDGWTITRR